MQIPEPRLASEFDGDTSGCDERCWHGDVLRLLAMQLGVGNDFYFPLLGAATLIDGRTKYAIDAAKRLEQTVSK